MLSGKQPWSEVREDAAVVLRLHLGHKPSRPKSRTIDDSHWNFIQCCWSPLEERPAAGTIPLFIQQFLNDHPPSVPLRDLLIPSSSQAQDPLVNGSSMSLRSQPMTEGPKRNVNLLDKDQQRYMVMVVVVQYNHAEMFTKVFASPIAQVDSIVYRFMEQNQARFICSICCYI